MLCDPSAAPQEMRRGSGRELADNAAPMRQERSGPAGQALPAVVALIAMGAGFGAMLVGPAVIIAARPGLRTLLAFSELCLAAPAVALLLARPAWREAALGAARPGRREVLAALAAGPALWVLSLGLFELQYAVWPPPPGYLEAFRLLHERLRPEGPLDGLVSLVTIAVVTSETFRGVLLPSLLRPLGALAASGASALLFGLIHLDRVPDDGVSLYRVPFAFAVGVGFAALRLAPDSLLPPLLAHATLNAITFFVAPFADDPSAGLPPAQPLRGLGLLVLGLASTLGALRALRRR
jgi:membrane protease YdiL (CAAX protease family)